MQTTLRLILGFLAVASMAAAQQNIPTGKVVSPGVILGGVTGNSSYVVFQATLSSNATSSDGTVVTRKQLGNCATGYSSGSLTPTGVPVGQLYCQTSYQSAGQAAGGPIEGVVSATILGTGIAGVDNGMNAGGTDSPVTITDTYGQTTTDSLCTSDSYASAHSVILGLTLPGCVTSSSALFGESTASGHGNSDVLFPSNWAASNVDSAPYAFRQIIFRVNNLTNLWDFEFDTNYNSASGIYYGWGMHWGKGATMFQYCPQNCTSWATMKFHDPNGVLPDVTSYPLTVNHVYVVQVWYHRGSVATCTYNSTSNCFFYDHIRLWDSTAGETPKFYDIKDAATGNPAGGIPVNHTTWTKKLVTTQVQVDMTTGNASTTVDVNSDVVIFYYPT